MCNICLLYLCIFALAGCESDFLPAPGGGEGGSVDLSGEWKLIETDMEDAMRPGYDDSRAQAIIIPGKWDHVLRKNTDRAATVWLRKKFVVHDRLRDKQMVLSLGRVSIADETYVNGVFVGSTGVIPPDNDRLSYDFTWHFERKYTVNSSLIRYGAENVIALRVFSHYLNGIKDGPVLYPLTTWNRLYWIRNYLPPVNNFIPLVISLVIVVMLIFLARGKINTRVYLYTSFFMVSVFIVYFLLLGIPPLSNGLLRYKLFFSAYTLIDFFLLMAIREFFGVKSKAPIVGILAVALAINACIALLPTTADFFRFGKIMTLAFLVLCVSYSLLIFIMALVRDPRRYWFISPVALFVVFSAVNTYYLVATDQMYRMSFMFIFRLVALELAALLYFILDLKAIEKERDSLSRALLKKTRELREAVNQATGAKKKDDPREIIHRLVDYIDNNFNETYDRVGLADKFGLNEDYMGQLFKKVTGTNIANYINCKRIEAARQLLEETDSKVIDIAFHVGFDNLTYFYRNFKKKTGYNPTDYRKMRRDGFVALEFKSEEDYY
ncbi:MAG TPA: helix-turn-helix domain-containing protein [Spirochaetota bacterium]|nr:helix-turn-helix domain-containing protein [Spirochaetota bacterium]HPI88494.1 helix-turn-helix domain-containing protein [Spirochaetota bacterium]HPR47974.1 helix-turn-helix domain-containing protein [Spirochaetota bacterium]